MPDVPPPLGRAYAILVTLLVCGAVLSPVRQGFLENPVDDFPLSWYPMFARPRPALERPVYVVAVDPDSGRGLLPGTLVPGRGSYPRAEKGGATLSHWYSVSRFASLLFPPAPSRRLAGVRILTGLYVLKDLWDGFASYAQIARTPVDQWGPVGPLRLLSGPLSPSTFDLWNILEFLLVACFVLGLGWRLLAPLAALSTLCFYAYRTAWGGVLHADNLFCLHMLCLSLGPAASAWSLDALLAQRWPQRLNWSRWPDLPEVHGWFGWNLRLISAVTTSAYLLAGIAKLARDPTGWPTGKSLLDQIGNDALYKELVSSKGATALVPWIYAHPEWLVIPVVLTLIIEVGAPLALLDRRLGWLWSFATCSLHHGIRIIMGIAFPYPLNGIAFASFFPLEVGVEKLGGILRWLRSRTRF